jgi:hypothetical protein
MGSGGTAGKSAAGNPATGGGGGDGVHEGGGAGGDPTSPSDVQDAERLEDCQTICATEAELACPPVPDQCVQDFCGTAALLPPTCVADFDLFLACLAAQPAEGFYCEDGMPYVKEETCAEEQAAFASSCGGG